MNKKYILPLVVIAFVIFLIAMFLMLDTVYDSGRKTGFLEGLCFIAINIKQTQNISIMYNTTQGQVELNQLCGLE